MMRSAFRATVVGMLVAGIMATAALAVNPQGTPPGQAKKDDAAAQSAPTSPGQSAAAQNQAPGSNQNVGNDPPGQARNDPPGQASTDPPGQAKKDDSSASNGNGNASTSSSSASAASGSPPTSGTITSGDGSYTGPAPNPSSKYQGCTASSAQSDGTGVKPGPNTKKDTCATAGSPDTKEYGNGNTAGNIVISRGGSPKTEIFGPGNSQPHKAAACPNGKTHFPDVHAIKNFSDTAACSSGPSNNPSISIEKEQRDASVPGSTFTSSPINANVGDTIEYRLTVRNTGNTQLTGVTITDPKCSGLSPSGPQTIDAGGSRTYTCTHTVVAGDAPAYTNTATVSGQGGGQTVNAGPVSVVANIPTPTSPSISIAKEQRDASVPGSTFTSSPINANVGDTIEYRLTVRNTGNTQLTGVTITDPKCSGLSPSGPQTIDAGGSRTYTCTHTVVAGDAPAYTNTATVSGQGGGQTVSGGPASVVANVLNPSGPGITVVKQQRNSTAAFTSGPDYVSGTISAKTGDTIQYRLTVTNIGNVALTNVTVSDVNCSGLTPTSVSSIAANGGTATFYCSHVLTAADGGSYTNVATATGTLPNGTQITSPPSSVTATVTTPGGGNASNPAAASQTASQNAAVPATVAGLAIVKTQRVGATGSYTRSQITAKVGDKIEYRIVVSNTGKTSLTLTLADRRCDPGTIAPSGTVSVAAGASQTYTCSHVVTASDPSTIVNTAIATGTTPGGASVGPVSSTVTAKKVGLLAAKKVHKAPAVHQAHKTPAVPQAHKAPAVHQAHKAPAVHKAHKARTAVVEHLKPVKHVAKKPNPVQKPAHFTG